MKTMFNFKNIELLRNPLIIKINDVFDDKTEKLIFAEAVKNKKFFETASIGVEEESVKDLKIRKNISAYYDIIYDQKRDKSILLSTIQKFFSTQELRSLLQSTEEPSMRSFTNTNYHETQVSRYGEKNDKYELHLDNTGDFSRLITFVYYFGLNKFEGGEIEFSNSPFINNKFVEKNPNIHKIKPIRNTMVIFSSYTPHKVLPTNSPKDFKLGRFSMNCWVGIK